MVAMISVDMSVGLYVRVLGSGRGSKSCGCSVLHLGLRGFRRLYEALFLKMCWSDVGKRGSSAWSCLLPRKFQRGNSAGVSTAQNGDEQRNIPSEEKAYLRSETENKHRTCVGIPWNQEWERFCAQYRNNCCGRKGRSAAELDAHKRMDSAMLIS